MKIISVFHHTVQYAPPAALASDRQSVLHPMVKYYDKKFPRKRKFWKAENNFPANNLNFEQMKQ